MARRSGARERDLLPALLAAIRPLGSVAVGYSGGVDSSVVALAAARVLGASRVLAVTADSPTLPASELAAARELAVRMRIPHAVISTRELECGGFSDNGPDRCFFCKEELWRRMRGLADERDLNSLADGVNADDVGDRRPGIRASDEAGVAHPLLAIGAGKQQVRKLARALGLPNWDKPAQACLSSRFPYGERITRQGLKRVELAEDLLRRLGFNEFRVRSHGDIARLEVPAAALAALAGNGAREAVVSGLKGLGFAYVTLDLEGFRSGSMNEALTRERER